MRSGPSSSYDDIYGHDLVTGEEFPICTAGNQQYDVAVWGEVVVWRDGRPNTNYTDIYGARWVPPNSPPVADAGRDQTVPEADPLGTVVALDGSGSYDPDGDELLYEWDTDVDGEFDDATGPTPEVVLGLDMHVIALKVTDPGGLSDTDAVVVIVEPGTPYNQLQMLRALIAARLTSGDISDGVGNSLLAKVDSAIAALDRDNPNDAKVAMNLLKALVHEVEADPDEHIDPATGAEIVERANRIIGALGA